MQAEFQPAGLIPFRSRLLLCRYNYFFRQFTVKVQTLTLTGGSLYGVYLVVFNEAQR